MAQTFSINEAKTLIQNLLHEVWEAEDSNQKKAGIFNDYMNVTPMSSGIHNDYRIAGFGKFTERDELEDINYDELEFGEVLSITPKNWATGFRVSEEVLEDLADAGPNEGISRAKLGTFADFTRRMRRSATWTVDQECADLLLNGTATSAEYVLRDSVALFGTHTTLKNPTVSQSNLNTHATISATTLDNMMVGLRLQVDDRGDYLMPGNSKATLVYSPSDSGKVYELLKTRGEVDSANNTVNRLDRFTFKPVENCYLNTLGAAYHGYFLLVDGVHSLNWKWRLEPKFGQENDFDAVAQKYRGRFRGVRYARDYFGTYGDNGS